MKLYTCTFINLMLRDFNTATRGPLKAPSLRLSRQLYEGPSEDAFPAQEKFSWVKDDWIDEMTQKFKLGEYEWPLDSFLNAEMHADSDYTYITSVKGSVFIQQAYGSCIKFIEDGNLARFVKGRTIGYLEVFGIEGFYESDLEKLNNWSQALISLYNKIESDKSLKALVTGKNAGKYRKFKDLISTCQSILDAFGKHTKQVK